MNFDFRPSTSDQDLERILELQKRNLEPAVGPEEAQRSGFLSLVHTLEILRQMQAAEAHVLAMQGDRLAGYALALVPELGGLFPDLDPMFAHLHELPSQDAPIAERPYLVMGQVCVDAAFRGQGVFDGLYAKLRELYSERYEVLVTELATRNGRSSRAHARVGFELLHRHPDEKGESWDLIVWHWRS